MMIKRQEVIQTTTIETVPSERQDLYDLEKVNNKVRELIKEMESWKEDDGFILGVDGPGVHEVKERLGSLGISTVEVDITEFFRKFGFKTEIPAIFNFHNMSIGEYQTVLATLKEWLIKSSYFEDNVTTVSENTLGGVFKYIKNGVKREHFGIERKVYDEKLSAYMERFEIGMAGILIRDCFSPSKWLVREDYYKGSKKGTQKLKECSTPNYYHSIERESTEEGNCGFYAFWGIFGVIIGVLGAVLFSKLS